MDNDTLRSDEPKLIKIGNTETLVLPPSWSQIPIADILAPQADRPKHKSGVITTQSLESFCELVNEHKTPDTHIYRVAVNDSITGHPKSVVGIWKFYGMIDDHSKDVAGWRNFKIEFKPEHSEEFTDWFKFFGREQSPQDAAKHILKHAGTLEHGSSIAKKFGKTTSISSLDMEYDPDTDDLHVKGSESTRSGNESHPRELTLKLRIYQFNDCFNVRVLVNVTAIDGKVKFTFNPVLLEDVLASAQKHLAAQVHNLTGIKVII